VFYVSRRDTDNYSALNYIVTVFPVNNYHSTIFLKNVVYIVLSAVPYSMFTNVHLMGTKWLKFKENLPRFTTFQLLILVKAKGSCANYVASCIHSTALQLFCLWPENHKNMSCRVFLVVSSVITRCDVPRNLTCSVTLVKQRWE
jgi:hypothetical protein